VIFKRSPRSKLSIPRYTSPLGAVQNTQDRSDTPRDTRDLISDATYDFLLIAWQHEKHERRRAAAHDDRHCRPHGPWHAPPPPPGRARAAQRRPGDARAAQRPYSAVRPMHSVRKPNETGAKTTKRRLRRGQRGRRRRRRRRRQCPTCGWCLRRHWRRCRRQWRYLRGAYRVLSAYWRGGLRVAQGG
jgi:hypothetical protein